MQDARRRVSSQRFRVGERTSPAPPPGPFRATPQSPSEAPARASRRQECRRHGRWRTHRGPAHDLLVGLQPGRGRGRPGGAAPARIRAQAVAMRAIERQQNDVGAREQPSCSTWTGPRGRSEQLRASDVATTSLPPSPLIGAVGPERADHSSRTQHHMSLPCDNRRCSSQMLRARARAGARSELRQRPGARRQARSPYAAHAAVAERGRERICSMDSSAPPSGRGRGRGSTCGTVSRQDARARGGALLVPVRSRPDAAAASSRPRSSATTNAIARDASSTPNANSNGPSSARRRPIRRAPVLGRRSAASPPVRRARTASELPV